MLQLKLTRMWKESLVHCSKIKYSCPLILFSRNISNPHSNLWSGLYQGILPFPLYTHENMSTNQQNERICHQIFKQRLNKLELVLLLTCGIPEYFGSRSKEVLFLRVDWKCCMLHGRNQRSNPFDVQACIQQFCLPEKNKFISTIMFAILPGVYPSHQSTKTRYSRSPHNHNN